VKLLRRSLSRQSFFRLAPRTALFIFVAELGSGAARKTRDIFWKFREAAYTWRKSAKQALEIACGLRKTCQMRKKTSQSRRQAGGVVRMAQQLKEKLFGRSASV